MHTAARPSSVTPAAPTVEQGSPADTVGTRGGVGTTDGPGDDGLAGLVVAGGLYAVLGSRRRQAPRAAVETRPETTLTQ